MARRFLPHPVVPWGPGAVLELLRLVTTPDPSYVVNLGDDRDSPAETLTTTRSVEAMTLFQRAVRQIPMLDAAAEVDLAIQIEAGLVADAVLDGPSTWPWWRPARSSSLWLGKDGWPRSD